MPLYVVSDTYSRCMLEHFVKIILIHIPELPDTRLKKFDYMGETRQQILAW